MGRQTCQIKHSTLTGKYEEGGFKDVDLQSNLHLVKQFGSGKW